MNPQDQPPRKGFVITCGVICFWIIWCLLDLFLWGLSHSRHTEQKAKAVEMQATIEDLQSQVTSVQATVTKMRHKVGDLP